jgi:parallel beta-helix repeat protein
MLLIIVSIICFVMVFSILQIFSLYLSKNNPDLDNNLPFLPEDKPIIITSYYNNSANPFYINATATGVGAHNWTWAQSQPWCTGNGTWEDPYIIENLTINANNQTSCIHIKNSAVFFIIQNCTLLNGNRTGGETIGGGIWLENTTNGKLRNNNCSKNAFFGISLQFGKNITVTNNTISDNKEDAIHFISESSNNTISNNTIKSNNNYGITFRDTCVNNTVAHNSIIYSKYGIVLNSDNNTIKNNKISHNNQTGVDLEGSSYNKLINNTLFNNSDNGLQIWNGNNNILLNNTSINNGRIGIWLYSSNHSKLINNNCSLNRDDGIKIQKSINNTLLNNSLIDNDWFGIDLINSHNNTLSLNRMIDNDWYGIYFKNSSKNNILNNTIVENTHDGIYIEDGSNNNSLYNNTIKNNGDHGVQVVSSHNNTLKHNNISYNQDYGIYLNASNYNTVINNSLIWNTGGCLFEEPNCIGNTLENNTCIGSGGGGHDGISWPFPFIPEGNPFNPPKGLFSNLNVPLFFLIIFFISFPILLLIYKWAKAKRKEKKSKKGKSKEKEKEKREKATGTFGEISLESQEQVEKTPEISSQSVSIEELSDFDEYRLKIEKQEQLDKQRLTQIDEKLKKAQKLCERSKFSEAKTEIEKALDTSQEIFNPERRKITAEQLKKEMKSLTILMIKKIVKELSSTISEIEISKIAREHKIELKLIEDAVSEMIQNGEINAKYSSRKKILEFD